MSHFPYKEMKSHSTDWWLTLPKKTPTNMKRTWKLPTEKPQQGKQERRVRVVSWPYPGWTCSGMACIPGWRQDPRRRLWSAPPVRQGHVGSSSLYISYGTAPETMERTLSLWWICQSVQPTVRNLKIFYWHREAVTREYLAVSSRRTMINY